MACAGVLRVLAGDGDRLWDLVVDGKEDEVSDLDTGTAHFIMYMAFPVFCFYVTLLVDWWLSKDEKDAEEDE
jgi:hypothetical protein